MSDERQEARDRAVELRTRDGNFWDQVFVPAPLVLVGTADETGSIDLAPKHQATPLGWQGYFGFACTPRHRTYTNATRSGAFTVSYPQPEHIVAISQAAAPRIGDAKPSLAAIATHPARTVAGVLVDGAALWLECEVARLVEGFGEHELIVGKIVRAAAPEWAVRSPDLDDADLVHAHPLLVYVCPSRFAAVSDSISFPFPVEFTR